MSDDPSGAVTERRLTLPQAARLFNLDRDLCERLLNELVAEGVLRRTDAGTYARAF